MPDRLPMPYRDRARSPRPTRICSRITPGNAAFVEFGEALVGGRAGRQMKLRTIMREIGFGIRIVECIHDADDVPVAAGLWNAVGAAKIRGRYAERFRFGAMGVRAQKCVAENLLVELQRGARSNERYARWRRRGRKIRRDAVRRQLRIDRNAVGFVR